MNEDISHNSHRIGLRKSFMIAGGFSNSINRLITKTSISFLYTLMRGSALYLIHLHLNSKHRFQKIEVGECTFENGIYLGTIL